jgi:O-methyltransferase
MNTPPAEVRGVPPPGTPKDVAAVARHLLAAEAGHGAAPDWAAAIAQARTLLAEVAEARGEHYAPSYDADHLRVWHRSMDFLHDPRFVSAYRRGMDSGHAIGRPPGSREDIHIEWRIHMCCWAAWHARRLPGAFVECGTNTGIMSLAVCEYVDFNATGKNFYLFDTFEGIPPAQMSERERALGRAAENAMYPDCWEVAQRNFAPFPRARLVRGMVPDSLSRVEIGPVAYLCIDMNIAAPERAAIEHFWPRLVTGAPVILDDYGWTPYREQKESLDEFARLRGVEIATLPTGQGLLIKS